MSRRGLHAEVFRGMPGDLGDHTLSFGEARFHHEDSRHRLSGAETEMRGEVLAHHAGDLSLPQLVDDELCLPHRQPGRLDRSVGFDGTWGVLSEHPVPQTHARTVTAVDARSVVTLE